MTVTTSPTRKGARSTMDGMTDDQRARFYGRNYDEMMYGNNDCPVTRDIRGLLGNRWV